MPTTTAAPASTTRRAADDATSNSTENSVQNSVEDGVEDVSGPCDEAEHANDPQCSSTGSDVQHSVTDESRRRGHGGGNGGGHGAPTTGATTVTAAATTADSAECRTAHARRRRRGPCPHRACGLFASSPRWCYDHRPIASTTASEHTRLTCTIWLDSGHGAEPSHLRIIFTVSTSRARGSTSRRRCRSVDGARQTAHRLAAIARCSSQPPCGSASPPAPPVQRGPCATRCSPRSVHRRCRSGRTPCRDRPKAPHRRSEHDDVHTRRLDRRSPFRSPRRPP